MMSLNVNGIISEVGSKKRGRAETYLEDPDLALFVDIVVEGLLDTIIRYDSFSDRPLKATNVMSESGEAGGV